MKSVERSLRWMKRASRAIGAASVVTLVLLLSSSCGPDAAKRCADLVAAPCPDGAPNHEDGPKYCESYYDSACSGEWDEYVTCALEKPRCGDSTSPCYESAFKPFARCLCEVESEHGWSPWCGF